MNTTAGLLTEIGALKAGQNSMEVLRATNVVLSQYIEELEKHSREMELIGGLNTLLNFCRSRDEAHAVVGRAMRKLFSGGSGGLYLFSGSENGLTPVAVWGDHHADPHMIQERIDRSLRERRNPVDGNDAPRQDHAADNDGGSFLAPIVAPHETLGAIVLESPDRMIDIAAARQRSMHHKRQLVTTIAETLALALENIRLREALYHQTLHDPLTGLFNRRAMNELLDKELQRLTRKKGPLGIVLVDLDHFKRFNDTFGHDAGDRVLREFGAFLQKHVRGGDLACRYGGEEFVLLLPEMTGASALQRADLLRQEIKRLAIDHNGTVLDPLTLSAGIAAFPQNGCTAEELLRAADAALYRAKGEGRDRVVMAGTAAQHDADASPQT